MVYLEQYQAGGSYLNRLKFSERITLQSHQGGPVPQTKGTGDWLQLPQTEEAGEKADSSLDVIFTLSTIYHPLFGYEWCVPNSWHLGLEAHKQTLLSPVWAWLQQIDKFV